MTEKAASSGRAADAPTGTVTFLFTDIEGSTSLWEKDPQRMQLALARHDRIMRSAIEEHEGYVFKTVGDAFCAAFKTAREALQAALSAQRALLTEGWETHAPIRVRMGLHTGVAEERDGDYFGPPVNRVARLESASHGGQVLLSAVTYGLVRDTLGHLEPGAELRDLGEHRLRDLRFAERIYQLIAPDLPKDFPAIKTLDTRSDERYGLKKLLGSGGMAEVYLAHDKELDRDVAFKVLKNQYSEDEQFVERFEREAKSAASLVHPNIAAVYDRGKTEDGAHYMVMECVTGGNLKERIEKEGPLPPGEAVSVALQVAEALRAAHERGVIHRDIKPQNILMTESGQAKVADFGIARAASSSTLTKTGFVVGTAHYLSPEQALGQPASPRSDLYSLGVVLYEMLTGEVPHDAETPVSIAMKHVSGRFRPPKEVNPNVPEGLNALTVRLLAKDPAERYTDADALIEDLERVRRGELPAAVATAQGEVPNGAAGTVAEPPDGRGPGGQPRQGEAIGVSPAEQETVPNRETARPSHTPRDSSLGNKKRVLLLAGVISILLVLLASGGTMALTGIGPAANLLGASERQPADEGPAVQSPDSQKGAAAGEKSTEETSSPSDNSAASQKSAGPEAPSGTASGGAGQAPAAQPTAKQDSPPSVEVPDLAGRSRSEASSKLTAAGLKLGNQNEASDDKVPEGKIVGQNPAAGTKAEPGSTVDITISSGPKKKAPPTTGASPPPPPTNGAPPPPPPTKGTPPPPKK